MRPRREREESEGREASEHSGGEESGGREGKERVRRLSPYRDKRSADRSPEPFGGEEKTGARGFFVVQKHAARRLHYDLRLEIGGALASWAVPKGPSLDPADKRLAIRVEDHPLEYADFEGVIPAESYGAGPVIVWDRGRLEFAGDAREGLSAGRLRFSLYGYKLRGEFALARTERSRDAAKETWLLIKTSDAHATSERAPSDASILSGLTIEELEAGASRAEGIRSALAASEAPRRTLDPGEVSLALCETRDRPFRDPDWLFELKYDGYRLLASKRAGEADLRYRRGREATALYPEIAATVRALPFDALILDGELAAFRPDGRTDFQRLIERAGLRRRADVRRASLRHPVALVAFDLLALEDYDLRSLPLARRKQILREVLPAIGPLRYADHIEGEGEALYEKVEELGLEGIIAKRKRAAYPGRRHPSWLKIPALHRGPFAVIGYTAGSGTRPGFGGLHLAARRGDVWIYAGKVGTGFSAAEIRALADRLRGARAAEPVDPGAPKTAEDHYVEPAFAVEIAYREWPENGLLRQPRALGVLEDTPPEACEAPARQADAEPPSPPADLSGAAAAAGAPRVSISNPEKVFWPDDGYTKGDLVAYYREMGPWLLPYLRDRPLVLTRYPDGIAGASFFQKDAPEWAPAWIRTETLWSEHAQRAIRYFVCDEPDAVVYLANLATIPLHIWSSRIAALGRPDWCILDLDPKSAPFAAVVRAARALGELIEKIGLSSRVKTSGATGLHILIPLGARYTYEESRNFAHLLARVIERRLPELVTTERALSRRQGRVYLDYAQNGHGRLLVSPFSVRARPGAPVSMPLAWDEVTGDLDPAAFTIRTAPARMRARNRDPLARVLRERADLRGALAALERELRGERNGS